MSLGINQVELASRIGIDPSVVNSWEKRGGNPRQNPFPTGETAQNAYLSSPTLFNNEVRFVNLRCISKTTTTTTTTTTCRFSKSVSYRGSSYLRLFCLSHFVSSGLVSFCVSFPSRSCNGGRATTLPVQRESPRSRGHRRRCRQSPTPGRRRRRRRSLGDESRSSANLA